MAGTGAQAVADELVALDHELASWIATEINRAFGTDPRNTLVRLRRHDRSAAAAALADTEVAAVVTLADAIIDRLGQRATKGDPKV